MSSRSLAYMLAKALTQESGRGAGQYYVIDVRHEGLKKYRRIKHRDRQVAENMADSQWQQWEDIWQRRLTKERLASSHDEKKELASNLTREAQEALEQLAHILDDSLVGTSEIDWAISKDHESFHKKRPTPPQLEEIPYEPRRTDPKYTVRIRFFERLFLSWKKKELEADRQFNYDHENWEQEKRRIENENRSRKEKYNSNLASWKHEVETWKSDQKKLHESVEEKKKKYFELNKEAILDYCEQVLSNSEYPDWFPKLFDLEYQPETKTIVVEYNLPSIASMPRTNEVKYIKSSGQLKEYLLSESAANRLYDSIVYQTTLRTIHELFDSDAADALGNIAFNGIVTTTDLGTGKQVSLCIVSIFCKKDEFLEINLEDVDPKACFKKLKGIGSSKLHGLAAVPPIVTINREDSRFVEAHGVAQLIDYSVNIAAMDWMEFEHLIRELFEKEFAANGGEVKITRASRDRGVDAIAFDPDPIRGGKIVIQAKRYTNTVDVAAVRDLYGTVLNEGAIKGILVTTSDYGPDAYDFAKEKPLTLLNGGNLLHLLAKHGHRAKIDLAEAKTLM